MAKKSRRFMSPEKREELRAYHREYQRKNRHKYRDYYLQWNTKHSYSGNFKKWRIKREKKLETYRRKYGYIFDHNGETYYSRKAALDFLPMKYNTLAKYQRTGVIPPQIYKRKVKGAYFSKGIVYYYSWTQIQMMRRIFWRTKRRKMPLKEASAYLYDNWTQHEKNFGDRSDDGSDKKWRDFETERGVPTNRGD